VTENAYTPDVMTPPGETLLDILNEGGTPAFECCIEAGLSLGILEAIVSGDCPITPEIAAALEKALGTPASFWLSWVSGGAGGYASAYCYRNMKLLVTGREGTCNCRTVQPGR